MFRTEFIPKRDGFLFRNGEFKFSVGPGECSVLCGGISYAALDYFYNKLRTPDMTRPPADGNPFLQYLFRRQATAHWFTWNRFLKAWLPGSDSQETVNKNLDIISTNIQAKKPVVVCMYGGFGHGHHVLAIGFNPSDNMIELYDSNWPGRSSTLTPDGDGKWNHSDGSVWDGWFTDGGFTQKGGAQIPVIPFKFCRNCHGLVANAFSESGVCAAGTHSVTDTEYFLPRDSSGGESGWYNCSKCLCMFTNKNGSNGKCFAGGVHAARSSWPEMSVAQLNQGKGEVDWRLCSACNTLNWGGGAPAACPAVGKHDNSQSGRYVVDNRTV